MAVSKIGTLTGGNGYCQLPDGTMIQWGSGSVNVSAHAFGNVAVTFSKSFISNPMVTASILGALTPYAEVTGVNAVDTSPTSATLRVYNNFTSQLGVSVMWIAIGNWK